MGLDVGALEGLTVGLSVAMIRSGVGSFVGLSVGAMEGGVLGLFVGSDGLDVGEEDVGLSVTGLELGIFVGLRPGVGSFVGLNVGDLEGGVLGLLVGSNGLDVGEEDVGAFEGLAVGLLDEWAVGLVDGVLLGLDDGVRVG
jgi:hypothetical protein